MPEETYEHLDDDATDDGIRDYYENLSDRDRAIGILLADGIDYEAHLIAIRSLLERHRGIDEEMAKKIQTKKMAIEQTQYTDHRRQDREIADLIADYHYSVFHGAAHSMAAVGMIAPFIESLFVRSFIAMRNEGMCIPLDHSRRKICAADQWDCHVIWSDNTKKTNLARGIIDLATAIGLLDHMPDDIEPMLSAIIAYRNKMFHCGFEWQDRDRRRFRDRLSSWPSEWFAKSEAKGKPWIFYMTPTFIDRCLSMADDIITGIGNFYKQRIDQR